MLKEHLYFDILNRVHRLFCYQKIIFDIIQVTSILPFWTTTKFNIGKHLLSLATPSFEILCPNSTSKVGPSLVCCRNFTAIKTEWHLIVSCTGKDAQLFPRKFARILHKNVVCWTYWNTKFTSSRDCMDYMNE